MSADLLRRAATVLRERATAGPAPRDFPWRAVREPARSGDGTVTSVITSADESVFEDGYCSLPDATYIATVHPGVGLALADWLDQEAAAVDDWDPATGGRDALDAYVANSAAHSVACAILGESA